MSANNEKKLPEGLGDAPLSKRGIISLTAYLLSMIVLLLVLLYIRWPSCELAQSTPGSSQPSNTNANGNNNRSTAGPTTANGNQGATTPGNTGTNPATGGASSLPATTTLPASTVNPSPGTSTPATGAASQTASAVNVVSVSPDSGPASGGRAVTINGGGFTKDVKVSFGGVDVKAEAVTAESILIKTPQHEPGKVEVTVLNPDHGFKTLPSAYTYFCPAPPGSQVLFLVILAGALGGAIHALRSLFWYVGNKEIVQSWVLMYIFLPFIGAAMAVVFFFIFRASSITSPVTAETSLSIIAIAALAGLFSEQAALKLKDIADAFFTKPGKGDDHKPQESKSTGESGANNSAAGAAAPKINPPKGKAIEETPVTITGVKYSTVKLTFGGVDAIDVKPDKDKATITAKTPKSDKLGPVDVIITSPEGSPIQLKYTYE